METQHLLPIVIQAMMDGFQISVIWLPDIVSQIKQDFQFFSIFPEDRNVPFRGDVAYPDVLTSKIRVAAATISVKQSRVMNHRKTYIIADSHR